MYMYVQQHNHFEQSTACARKNKLMSGVDNTWNNTKQAEAEWGGNGWQFLTLNVDVDPKCQFGQNINSY